MHLRGKILSTINLLNSYQDPNSQSKPQIKGFEVAPGTDFIDGNSLILYAADYGEEQVPDGRFIEIDLTPDRLLT